MAKRKQEKVTCGERRRVRTCFEVAREVSKQQLDIFKKTLAALDWLDGYVRRLEKKLDDRDMALDFAREKLRKAFGHGGFAAVEARIDAMLDGKA